MRLYTRNELNDGRIFFDKQPPRYMTVFIIFLVFFLIASVVGAKFVNRPYVVKAQGTISVDGKSYISTKTQGVVTNVHAESGEYVKAGDVILELSSGNEGLQKSVADAQIDDLENTLEIMDKYEASLEEGKNKLSQDGKELEYYGKVSYYLDLLSQETYEENKAGSKIDEKNKELSNLRDDIKKIESNLTNLDDQSKRSNQKEEAFNKSIIKKEEEQQVLITEISELEERISGDDFNDKDNQNLIKKQQELDELTKVINDMKEKHDETIGENDLVEQKAELKSELDMKKSEIKGLEEELQQLKEENDSPYSQAKQTQLQLISELGEKQNQIKNQLTELRANAGVASEQDTVHVIKATESGTLHYLQPVSIGMSLQQNQIVGEVATEEEGFYVDAYIQAQDRSKIAVGQAVNVAIQGVNNYRFGTIDGTVDFIEPGTIQNETSEGVVNLYRVRVSLTEMFLTSKSDEVIDLVRSMPAEARVIYQEESYLEWLLDLLNLKSK